MTDSEDFCFGGDDSLASLTCKLFDQHHCQRRMLEFGDTILMDHITMNIFAHTLHDRFKRDLHFAGDDDIQRLLRSLDDSLHW